MELRFHHVGIATPDLSAAISVYLNLGYRLDDIDAAIAHCRSLRFRPVSTPVPAVAFENRLIVFVHNPFAGLVELLESDANTHRHYTMVSP